MNTDFMDRLELEAERLANSSVKPLSLDFIHISELMQTVFPDAEWIVDRLIPAESIVGISGAPATFKTWLAWELAKSIATGQEVFGKFKTMQTPILMIDEENSPRLLQRRLQKQQLNTALPIHLLCLKGFILTEDAIQNVIAAAAKWGARLVMLDSLVRLHTAKENDAMEMAGVFRLLKELTKAGITVIFIHHNRKQGALQANPSQDMRGSSDILASLDCHLSVERKEGHLVIRQTKLRQDEEMKPFKLNIIGDEDSMRFEYGGEPDEVRSKKNDAKDALKKILVAHDYPLSKEELFEFLKQDEMEIGMSTLKTCLDELTERKEIAKTKREKNKNFYSAVLPISSQTQSILSDLESVGLME